MTMKPVELSQFDWLNPPEQVEIANAVVEFATQPGTDFWQRTHYGFRRNNGHAFLIRLWDDFAFSAQVEFFYEALYDQAGIMIYQDEDNWAKASIEYGNEVFGMLGSVVTSHGYSDWATMPISTDVTRMWYRVSRKGTDFRFETSSDGESFHQLRIFHLHGDLSTAKVGLYACSPSDSTFKVRFSEITAGAAVWK